MGEVAGAQVLEVETTYGVARVLTWPAPAPRGDLLLMHGAGGKLDSPDLARLVADLPGLGVTTRLLQQPFAVAGKRIGPRPAALDAALDDVVGDLRPDGPLVLGGRSAGARSAVRRAGPLGAVGALALAFPLHPPGRPERSRAEELHACTVSTLVVQGERDPFGGPAELSPSAHQQVVAVPGADHGFAVPKRWDGPDPASEVSRAVARWLGALLGGAGE